MSELEHLYAAIEAVMAEYPNKVIGSDVAVKEALRQMLRAVYYAAERAADRDSSAHG